MGKLTDRITGFFSDGRPRGFNPGATVRDVISSASFSTNEFDTGLNWIDGRPVFGLVVEMAGGNLLSSKTVPELDNTFPIAMTCLVPIAGIFIPLTELIYNPAASPQLSVNHATLNLTGDTLVCLLQYVKDP